jgi:hypothetical protein
LKFRIKPIAFAGVTALAEGVEITEVIAAALGEGNNVVDAQVFGSAAFLAGVIVSIEDVRSDSFRDSDALGLLGFHGSRGIITNFPILLLNYPMVKMKPPLSEEFRVQILQLL